MAGSFGARGWYLDVHREEERSETWTFGVIDPGGTELVPLTLTVMTDSIHDDGGWDIESLSALDLDGDGIDEPLELSRALPRQPNAYVATVHQIVDSKLVHIPGEDLAYRHVNILTRAVTECASTLRFERAVGGSTRLHGTRWQARRDAVTQVHYYCATS